MNSHLRGILVLIFVTLVWGTTFPAMKELTVQLTPLGIIAARFGLAAVVLLPFLLRARLLDAGLGLGIGVLLFFCYVFQVEGLALTSSNRNAFITGLNVLVVPLLGVLAGRLPERRIVLALLLALAGIAALCYDGGAWGRGDTLALLGAITFGVYVKAMEVGTRRASSMMSVTAGQISSVAICAWLWLGLRGGPAEPWLTLGSGAWWSLAYLGLICTAAIIALQTWGQRQASANEAAVIYAFEPASAAFFAWLWLGETMSPRAWLGAALLISGMIVSQWHAAARPAAALAPE